MTYKQRIEEIVKALIGHADGDEFLGNGYHDECAEDVANATTQLLALMDEFGDEVIGDDEPYDKAPNGDVMAYSVANYTRRDQNRLRTEARTRKQELLK